MGPRGRVVSASAAGAAGAGVGVGKAARFVAVRGRSGRLGRIGSPLWYGYGEALSSAAEASSWLRKEAKGGGQVRAASHAAADSSPSAQPLVILPLVSAPARAGGGGGWAGAGEVALPMMALRRGHRARVGLVCTCLCAWTWTRPPRRSHGRARRACARRVGRRSAPALVARGPARRCRVWWSTSARRSRGRTWRTWPPWPLRPGARWTLPACPRWTLCPPSRASRLGWPGLRAWRSSPARRGRQRGRPR
jgi:hypothetical protein